MFTGSLQQWAYCWWAALFLSPAVLQLQKKNQKKTLKMKSNHSAERRCKCCFSWRGVGAEAQRAQVWVSVQVLEAQPHCWRSPCSTSGWRRQANYPLALKLRAVKVSAELAAFRCVFVLCLSGVLQSVFWHHVSITASATGTFYNKKKKNVALMFYFCIRDVID